MGGGVLGVASDSLDDARAGSAKTATGESGPERPSSAPGYRNRRLEVRRLRLRWGC